ncbi:hypothetical protein BD413DRAFT_640527 [Trametes elegans]|nr:hypothetical protein BD413DRAFT_640527 [Trametes elegans]
MCSMATNSSFADLSLFPATREQVVEARKRTSVQWAKGDSLEHYLQREVVLEKHGHAADGKHITWVLAPRNDPTTLDFMCSCETYRRTAVVAKRAKQVDAREVREVVAYGVASVFTPEHKRGKGYARHMMRLLHWALAHRSALPSEFPAEWGAPPDPTVLHAAGVANGQFSVLYSDVGREFYHSAGLTPGAHDGWVVKGALETSRLVADAPEAQHVPEGLSVVRLGEDDVLALYNRDAAWIKDDLSKFAGDTDSTLFSFLPDQGVGAFVFRRLVQFGEELKPSLPATHWGFAVLPHGTALKDALGQDSPLSFATWTLELKTSPRALVVSRVRADANTFPIILDQLLAVAREHKLGKVEFWYLRPELRAIANALGWKTGERPDHLSAVKWYGEEKEDELEWVYNEKYGVHKVLSLGRGADDTHLDSAGARVTTPTIDNRR